MDSGFSKRPVRPNKPVPTPVSTQVDRPRGPVPTPGSIQVERPSRPRGPVPTPGSIQIERPSRPRGPVPTPGSIQVERPSRPRGPVPTPGAIQVERPSRPRGFEKSEYKRGKERSPNITVYYPDEQINIVNDQFISRSKYLSQLVDKNNEIKLTDISIVSNEAAFFFLYLPMVINNNPFGENFTFNNYLIFLKYAFLFEYNEDFKTVSNWLGEKLSSSDFQNTVRDDPSQLESINRLDIEGQKQLSNYLMSKLMWTKIIVEKDLKKRKVYDNILELSATPDMNNISYSTACRIPVFRRTNNNYSFFDYRWITHVSEEEQNKNIEQYSTIMVNSPLVVIPSSKVVYTKDDNDMDRGKFIPNSGEYTLRNLEHRSTTDLRMVDSVKFYPLENGLYIQYESGSQSYINKIELGDEDNLNLKPVYETNDANGNLQETVFSAGFIFSPRLSMGLTSDLNSLWVNNEYIPFDYMNNIPDLYRPQMTKKFNYRTKVFFSPDDSFFGILVSFVNRIDQVLLVYNNRAEFIIHIIFIKSDEFLGIGYYGYFISRKSNLILNHQSYKIFFVDWSGNESEIYDGMKKFYKIGYNDSITILGWELVVVEKTNFVIREKLIDTLRNYLGI